jgi:signal transduction histidine kinase
MLNDGTMAGCERQELISDLFHALNQPLTTLRCSLELALQQPRTARQYRDGLSAALAQAERIARLASGLRDLLEADDAGDDRQVLALEVCLQETVVDLLPVAEIAGVRLSFQRRSPCRVFFEPRRLRQALFHLMSFALDSGRGPAAVIIETAEREKEAALLVTTSRQDVASPQNLAAGPAAKNPGGRGRELARRLDLAIARGMFEAAGGWVRLESGEECLSVEVRLPRASCGT